MTGKHGLAATLAHLYSLEINCGISSFCFEGWTAWIGDDMNGRFDEALIGDLEAVPAWLRQTAARRIREWRRGRRAVARRKHIKVAL